jgi:hypothetical protein
VVYDVQVPNSRGGTEPPIGPSELGTEAGKTTMNVLLALPHGRLGDTGPKTGLWLTGSAVQHVAFPRR